MASIRFESPESGSVVEPSNHQENARRHTETGNNRRAAVAGETSNSPNAKSRLNRLRDRRRKAPPRFGHGMHGSNDDQHARGGNHPRCPFDGLLDFGQHGQGRRRRFIGESATAAARLGKGGTAARQGILARRCRMDGICLKARAAATRSCHDPGTGNCQQHQEAQCNLQSFWTPRHGFIPETICLHCPLGPNQCLVVCPHYRDSGGNGAFCKSTPIVWRIRAKVVANCPRAR